MKRALVVLTLIALLIMGVAGAYSWWSNNTQPVSNDSNLRDFVVRKGASAAEVGNELESEGLIRSPLAFKIYLQLRGQQMKLLAGEYRLSPSYSVSRILEELTKGPTEVWVTIPEGLRREETVERFIEGLDKKGDEAVNFRQEFVNLTEGKEGYLFPDTYLFPRSASVQVVVNKMLETFDKKVDPLIPRTLIATRYGLKEYIILASIIERETKTNEERPIVAGILYKRIDKGWPLEVDASLQYAVANIRCKGKTDCEWWETPGIVDKNIDSPYNLYKSQGLPPAPIASPGLSSIKATVSPVESNYWFYIHDTNGKIHYAETLEEHNQNIHNFLGN